MSTITSERFWARVQIKGPDDCWDWKLSCDGKGYGQGGTMKRGVAKFYKAHRVAWELTNGPIPSGLFVCHKCDRPPCCNPAHLFLGTNQDNMDDMVRKGRSPNRRWPMGIIPGSTSDKHRRKTVCPKCGGPYKKIPRGDGSGREKRHCTPCRNKWQRVRYEAKKP